jgi:hypothetical protein
MKSWLLKLLLAFTVAHTSMRDAYSQIDIEMLSASIEKAASAHDTSAVSSAIGDVEDLWPHAPDAYLEVVSQAVRVLQRHPDNSMLREALAELFKQVFDEKTCPVDNNRQSITYFDLKREIALSYFGMDATRNDKTRLRALAGFIGEIRSHIILDYTNKGTSRPGMDILDEAGVSDARLLSDAEQLQAYREAVKENEEHLVMNELQSTLLRADRILTFHLIHSCSRFSSTDPADNEFRRSIAREARLSENEERALHEGRSF